jgi:hypothetical protein
MSDQGQDTPDFDLALLDCRLPEGFDLALLHQRAEGTLSEAASGEVEAHLAACPHCTAYVQALARVPPPPPFPFAAPAPMPALVPARVTGRRAQRRARRAVSVAVGVIAAATAGLALSLTPPAPAPRLQLGSFQSALQSEMGAEDAAPAQAVPLRYAEDATIRFVAGPAAAPAGALEYWVFVRTGDEVRALPPEVMQVDTQWSEPRIAVTLPVRAQLGSGPQRATLEVCAAGHRWDLRLWVSTPEDVRAVGGQCVQQGLEIVPPAR